MPKRAYLEQQKKPLQPKDYWPVVIIARRGPITLRHIHGVSGYSVTHDSLKHLLDKIRIKLDGLLKSGNKGYKIQDRSILQSLPLTEALDTLNRRLKNRGLPPFE